MTWDTRWMDLALLVASWSKDRSRKVGAVIVDDRQNCIALGWNGFPRGVDDDVDHRHERPAKYLFTAHAELNAITNAAANGHPLRGATIYSLMYTCAPCAQAVIQAGLTKLICSKPDWSDTTYGASFRAAREMYLEAEVDIRFVTGYGPIVVGDTKITHLCDGEKHEFSGSPGVPCDGVRLSDGTYKGGCGEPCRWIMNKEGEGNPPWTAADALS